MPNVEGGGGEEAVNVNDGKSLKLERVINRSERESKDTVNNLTEVARSRYSKSNLGGRDRSIQG